MTIESGKIEGDFEVDENLKLHGMITGNAFVKNGATLRLHGTVCKDLTIEEGSKAIINGTVCGNVINEGGVVEVYGVVYGNVSGPVNIDGNAVIKGEVYT